MPFEPKIKLGKVGNSFKVTIPSEMIEELGWKSGDILRIGLDDEKLIIRKSEKIRHKT